MWQLCSCIILLGWRMTKKKNSNKLFSYWNGALILKAQKRYKKQITSAQSKCAKGHCMTGHRSFHTKKGHIHKSSWGGNTDDMFPKCHHTILHPVLSLRGHFLSLMRGLKNGQEAFFPQDIQGINNNSPKKVSTILKHYFYFVHYRGLLYGKAVGVELRTR